MGKLHELAKHGQAVWYDYIRRSFLTSGEMQRLLDTGVRGMTSNPSIFEKAIAGSADYDEDLKPLVESGQPVEAIYESLALRDIKLAADLLRPVYDETDGVDGYISLEVSPTLAFDTEGTIAEARRLFRLLDRPNVMIKVPATPAGFPAIKTLIGDGINVNVTLIFSVAHYEAAAEAYIAGLEQLIGNGGAPGSVASVASFFISRVDSAVDHALERIGETSLQGTIAIANAKVAYARFREISAGDRWGILAKQGARAQRPLWASTSTKNPTYPDTLYVDSLVGEETVNTVPPATLRAFLDHGKVAATLERDLDQARSRLEQLGKLGIDLNTITSKLQDDGVAAFAKSFETLMASIAEKRNKIRAGWAPMTAGLGPYQRTVDQALEEMREHQVMVRIWAHDHTVWKPEPTEITNRLGWLNTAAVMQESLPRLHALAADVHTAGYTHAVLLGMGGSSLAPEVFRRTFGVKTGFLRLDVLDSTDPDAVLAVLDRLDLARTLFLVSTKSGGTVETLSFFKFFYNHVVAVVGDDRAGEHFVAITDPGSSLVELASRFHFRATFLNDPNIGGRYSALSFFGIVPAVLIGMDVETLLERAMGMECNCEGCNCPSVGDNLGGRLGAILGELAGRGRDKVTFLTSSAIAGFGDWVEQLIAESTGKEGKGILPVVGEPPGAPDIYGDDRLFVWLHLNGDDTDTDTVGALETAGYPLVRLRLKDKADLGGQFFLWEMAIAVAGARMGINPFDQPNVESAKVLARKMVAAYHETGELPGLAPALDVDGIKVYTDLDARTPAEALTRFLSLAQQGAYIALQAYVQPTEETDTALRSLRVKLRDRTRLATTLGYGPRFLHSTGQLHKGDAGKGLFIQLTSDAARDADIPDNAGSSASSMTFGVLKEAQVLGDRQALLDAGRKVIRFHLGRDVSGGLQRLWDGS